MPRRTRSAFTLVEVLVVTGIVSVLTGVLLPAIGHARERSRRVVCASNLRQVCLAITNYATDNRGRYPPNAGDLNWYDPDRIGGYLKPSGRQVAAGQPFGGPTYTCPNDDPYTFLSYGMNVWAGCGIDSAVTDQVPVAGRPFDARVKYGSQMILAAEAWAAYGSQAAGWRAGPTVGSINGTAGQRFGGGGGLAPPLKLKRFGLVATELPFYRHRDDGRGVNRLDPRGRVNVGFVDGHVALLSDADLVGRGGASIGVVYWSPLDVAGY